MAQQLAHQHSRKSVTRHDFSRLAAPKRTKLDKAIDWATVVWAGAKLVAAAVLTIIIFAYIGQILTGLFGATEYRALPESIYRVWLILAGVSAFGIGTVFFWGEMFPKKVYKPSRRF